MGLFDRKITCPACGKTYLKKLFDVAMGCPNCSNKPTVPDYDIIGPIDGLTVSKTTFEGLIQAGLSFPGAQVCQSMRHASLMAMATRHAIYQADRNQQGHQLFQARCEELRTSMGMMTFAEIAAESWPWQKSDTYLNLGTEMFKCWSQSPGHWSVASVKHKYFGADMALGSNRLWYACILTAD
jgi:hypothetical protein